MKLRGYQTRAIEQTREAIREGRRKVLIVAPTGSGKTVIGSAIIRSAVEHGRRVLFLAHRRELIKQAWTKLVRCGLHPGEIGCILAGVDLPRQGVQLPFGGFDSLEDDDLWKDHAARRPDAPIQVASVQTLVRRQLPPCNIIVIDEAHRSRAASYEKIVAANPRAIVLGLTATPVRSDGKSLGDFYERMVVVAQYQELVDEGHLVPCSVAYKPKDGVLPNLEGIKLRGKDYDLGELQIRCNQNKLVGGIVDRWLEHGNRAPTFVFAAGVEHSRTIVEQFKAKGVRAAHVDGETPTDEREQILRDLGTGALEVVSNCDVCTEGTDVPAVKTIVLARPTRSLRVYLQMVGRASRPHPNGFPFVILDHAGVFDQPGFGWPQSDREWSLSKKKKRKRGPQAAPTRDCLGCWAMVPFGLSECPHCGYEFPRPERATLQEIEGELEAIRQPKTQAECMRAWRLIVEEWKRTNEERDVPVLPGKCFHSYRDRYGMPPPSGCKPPKLTAEQVAIRKRFDALKRQEVEQGLSHGWAWGRIQRELPKLRKRVA